MNGKAIEGKSNKKKLLNIIRSNKGWKKAKGRWRGTGQVGLRVVLRTGSMGKERRARKDHDGASVQISKRKWDKWLIGISWRRKSRMREGWDLKKGGTLTSNNGKLTLGKRSKSPSRTTSGIPILIPNKKWLNCVEIQLWLLWGKGYWTSRMKDGQTGWWKVFDDLSSLSCTREGLIWGSWRVEWTQYNKDTCWSTKPSNISTRRDDKGHGRLIRELGRVNCGQRDTHSNYEPLSKITRKQPKRKPKYIRASCNGKEKAKLWGRGKRECSTEMGEAT